MLTRLITGSTGFIGSNLVKEFLKEENSRLVLLARSSKHESAYERIENIFRGYNLKNVEVIEGDIEKTCLGIDSNRAESLEKEVNQIWHLAASTDMLEKADKLRANIDGTQNVIDFAWKAKKLKLFAYMSTAYVAGKRNGKVLEDELDVGQELNNPYEVSKLIAESKVQECIKNRLSCIVFRPSVVVGNSETGETQSFKIIYGPWLAVKQVQEMYLEKMRKENKKPQYKDGKIMIPFQIIGNDNASLNIIPINSVVDMIIGLSKDEANIGKTFHLTNPVYTTMGFLREQICEYLGITGVMYVTNINDGSKFERTYERRTRVYQPYMLFNDPEFDRSNISRALPNFNIHKPNEKLMRTLIGYAESVNWGRKGNN